MFVCTTNVTIHMEVRHKLAKVILRDRRSEQLTALCCTRNSVWAYGCIHMSFKTLRFVFGHGITMHVEPQKQRIVPSGLMMFPMLVTTVYII